MVLPGALAVIVPLLVGFLLGREAVAGMLVGAIGSGFMLAVMMANSGGAWDNAKKWIETGAGRQRIRAQGRRGGRHRGRSLQRHKRPCPEHPDQADEHR
ncbi:MAG: sodium/proton-translocating pyrophosphatase [Caldilineaceae bacterium]